MANSMPSHLTVWSISTHLVSRGKTAYMHAEMTGKIQALSHHRSYLDHCTISSVVKVRTGENM